MLQTNDYSERDSSQEFMLRMIRPEEVPALNGSGFIWSRDKKRAIDLASAHRPSQNEIVLNEPNYRMNQRWVF